MAKNNVRAITAEGEMTFDQAFTQMHSIVAAEVPISADDKKGGRPITVELANMEFIITNAPKLDADLPKNIPTSVYADDDALLKEKQRQLQEVKRLEKDIENQIAVIKIRIKNNVKEFYAAALKAGKRDSTLQYIRTKMEVWYARSSNNNDTPAANTTTDQPK
jgi:hypothetical protein